MHPLIQFLTTPLSQHLSKLLQHRIGVLDLRMHLADLFESQALFFGQIDLAVKHQSHSLTWCH